MGSGSLCKGVVVWGRKWLSAMQVVVGDKEWLSAVGVDVSGSEWLAALGSGSV